jgi:hypothetical protein
MLNKVKKVGLVALALHSIATMYASPYFEIRSQGVNAARDLAGESNYINLASDCLYGTVYGLFEYTRSFDPAAITRCLFCPDLTTNACGQSAIAISGSQAIDRGSSDWLADYFGLPTDYKSTIHMRPQIQNYIIDLGLYLGLDEWAHGLYFKIHAPITHTKWDLDFLETVSVAGSNSYPPGYFNGYESGAPAATPPITAVGVTRGNLVTNFTDFITGAQVPSLTQVAGSTFPASTFYNLANAQFSNQALVKTGLAELTAVFGWNWAKPDYHAGLNLRIACPTGTKPQGIYAFEPIVGNGHHWEFGGGLTGHYQFWCDEENERHMGIYADANFTHLFSARQHRTFDLIGKPNSRYMLAEQIDSARLTPQLSATFPNVEFQSIFSPVANLTTMDVNVSIALQVDMVAMFNFTSGPYSLDFGYDFWATTCENISKRGCPSPLDDGMTWALKGDASVVGFQDDSATTAAFAPVRLAATESLATIHAGTNFPIGGTTSATAIIAGRANPNIDSPALATTNATPALNVVISPAALSATNPQTSSSTNPVYLSLDSVDFTGIKGLSNKLFAHFNYSWITCNNWMPYLGFGGEAEFGLNGKCSSSCGSSSSVTTCRSSSAACSTGCNSCERCSVSQWGIWFKGGVNF